MIVETFGNREKTTTCYRHILVYIRFIEHFQKKSTIYIYTCKNIYMYYIHTHKIHDKQIPVTVEE